MLRRLAPARISLPAASLNVAILALVCAMSLGEAAEEPDAQRRRLDPALIRAVEAIRDGFRASRIEPLRAVLPTDGKVYLAVRILAPERSLYSRDQVEALLTQAFSNLTTVQFHINMDHSRSAAEGGAMVVCPATWSYQARGQRAEANLRFLMIRREDRWLLSELREAR